MGKELVGVTRLIVRGSSEKQPCVLLRVDNASGLSTEDLIPAMSERVRTNEEALRPNWTEVDRAEAERCRSGRWRVVIDR
jgi:hypothetical protein